MTWKYYLSIMAVSLYDSEYLLKILEEQFLLYGGDVTWLTEGFKKVYHKLQRVGDLNEIVAFRPWSLELPAIIENLASGDNSWSI